MTRKTRKVVLDKAKLRKLTKSRDPFASLGRSIIYQQLSTKAADTICGRLIALFTGKKFPTPEDVLKLSDATFKSAGVSGQKMGYLRDLAVKFLDGTIEPKKFSKMTDQEIREHVVRVKGIGTWTADMFLIFALNRPDVLPTGDLGVKKGFQKLFNLDTLPDEETMLRLARPYEGERTYLSLYLWQSLDGPIPKVS